MTKKTGRKPSEPPANAAALIEALAARRFSVIGIARGLNTSKETLRRWFEERPELEEAMRRGRDAQEQSLYDKLYDAAMKGNVVAAIYLTKARFGWREGDQSDTANKVSITFTLPGAATPEQFKVIEHEQPLLLPAARPTHS